uniref:Zgc:56095 n=1 Tax=Cynoglossus semilaevis TaxID=244447 RepID=A0A3P8WUB1_CYNSE
MITSLQPLGGSNLRSGLYRKKIYSTCYQVLNSISIWGLWVGGGARGGRENISVPKRGSVTHVPYYIGSPDTPQKPSRDDWKGGLDAMSFSLDFQKSLNACILEVHRRADGNTDPHLCDFLEQNFLEDSYDTIKKLGDYNKSLTSITASDTHGSLGEYLFDKHTL